MKGKKGKILKDKTIKKKNQKKKKRKKKEPNYKFYLNIFVKLLINSRLSC